MRPQVAEEEEHAAGDGRFCAAVQRPLARPLAHYLAAHMSANAVTALDFGVGLLAAAAIALGLHLLGIVLIHVFGVLSCLDGEVARRRGEASRLGDYFDTMVDRSVECLVVMAIVTWLARAADTATAYGVGVLLLSGVVMLTSSAEKFRAAYGVRYPKRVFEGAFGWVSAGSDGRFLALSVALSVAVVLGDPLSLLYALVVLTAVVYCNVLVRFWIVWSRTAPNGDFR